jgi:uncharacterized damage-inducible protein DinB
MNETRETLTASRQQALTGRGAHVLTLDALDGMPWKLAGDKPPDAPHSVFQIVNHLVYWQDFSLAWIDGERVVTPEHAAESWPGEVAPATEAEWLERVAEFERGLMAFQERIETLDPFEERGPKTVLEIVQLISSHNSYHVGQICLLRRMVDAWPPPGGGATW